MKKYIKPATKVVTIETESMICQSPLGLHDAQGNQSWHSKGRGRFDDDDDWEDEIFED